MIRRKWNEVKVRDLIKSVQNGNDADYPKLLQMLTAIVSRWMEVSYENTGQFDREASERFAYEIYSRFWEDITAYQPQKGIHFRRWFYNFCWRRKKQLLREDRRFCLGRMDELNDLPAPGSEPQSIYERVSPDPQTALRQKDSILNKLIEQENQERLINTKEILRDAIYKLGDVEQYVIYKRFIDDNLSYRKISEQLEGTPHKTGYYKVFCQRTIKKLRKILQAEL